ncbi:pur operon repressor [Alicyclobacillus mengziensis]|uniref:Pur operon repressor n=1 Tax=Alicyclobacillus mengziensis TaxID=2931921 RepID=A0A9X7Z853_9BACL|nr:pur operon repressor [Alicyclobacillus mengziensis]QSO47928.1 pur operon repressor [Alicyclobacillus mengziensis]
MRRSERLIGLTKHLLDRPNQAVSLSEIQGLLEAAKSSLSEDVGFIRQALENLQQGTVQTISGAAGGVRYVPRLSDTERALFSAEMVERLSDPSRMLAGGFVYMSDILGDPLVIDYVGRLFAEAFVTSGVNVVVTVETKGIPLAVATAHYLHCPLAIVRREHRVTDGAVVSVHYVSGSNRRIQSMSISKRAMPDFARALVVDDFMKAGATCKAVVHLLAEFQATVVGTAVFAATAEPLQKLVDDYKALFEVSDLEEGRVPVVRSTMFWETQ